MAAARYTWMFRTAAVVFLALGAAWLYTFGVTSYHPEQRPYGLAAAAIALLTGAFLLRRKKVAIAISAAAAAIVAISATAMAPSVHGPAILFLVGLAILCGAYSILAARELFGRGA